MKSPRRLLLGHVPRSCEASTCRRDGCQLKLTDTPSNHVLVNLDCTDLGISDSCSRCDFIFFSAEQGKPHLVVPIELKSGRIGRPKAVRKQLQAGANIARKWISPGSSAKFYPVLIHGKGIKERDLRDLRHRKNWISFCGVKKRVMTGRCGSTLMKTIGHE